MISPMLLKLGAGVALAAAAVAGLQWWTSSIEARGFTRGQADVQGRWTQADLARTRAALRQSEVQREEEGRREAAKQQEVTRAQEDRRLALDAAARADRAADGLRDQLATFVSDARARAAAADPGAAQRGQAAGAELDLLADVLRGLEQAGRAIAAEADAYRGPGVTAERLYDALTPSPAMARAPRPATAPPDHP